ncbi:MAG: L,D-transpeptidase family protein [Bacteroidia bacterium]
MPSLFKKWTWLFAIAFIIVAVIVISTNKSKKNTHYIERPFIQHFENPFYKTALQKEISEGNWHFPFLTSIEKEKLIKQLISDIYSELDYEYLWWDTLSNKIKDESILRLFQSLPDSGYEPILHLPLLYYYAEHAGIDDFESIIELELAFTATYIDKAIEIGESALIEKQLKKHFSMYGKANLLIEKFFELEPQNIFYQSLIKSYRQFLLHQDISLKGINRENYHTEKLNYIRKYFCADSTGNTEMDSLLIQNFCNQHGLFNKENFSGTCDEFLSWDNAYRMKKINFTLKEIRENNIQDSVYVLLNIPSFQAFVVVNNMITDTFRAIVGKPETPTPTLHSKIYNINTFPEWNVPYSIASKEILPHLKKDPNYLIKKKYRAYDKNNKEINSTEVNWNKYSANNFPYRLVREAGVHNDLGLIKIQFHNKYSVYMHDTPSRNLFAKDVRAFSHGCMRIDNTFQFAARILDLSGDSIPADTLRMMAQKELNRNLPLKKQIPVYVTYFTALGSENGNVFFFKDLYRKEM